MDETDKMRGMQGGKDKWRKGLEGNVKEDEHMDDLRADFVVIKTNL